MANNWVRHGVSAFGWLAPSGLRVFEPSERGQGASLSGRALPGSRVNRGLGIATRSGSGPAPFGAGSRSRRRYRSAVSPVYTELPANPSRSASAARSNFQNVSHAAPASRTTDVTSEAAAPTPGPAARRRSRAPDHPRAPRDDSPPRRHSRCRSHVRRPSSCRRPRGGDARDLPGRDQLAAPSACDRARSHRRRHLSPCRTMRAPVPSLPHHRPGPLPANRGAEPMRTIHRPCSSSAHVDPETTGPLIQ